MKRVRNATYVTDKRLALKHVLPDRLAPEVIEPHTSSLLPLIVLTQSDAGDVIDTAVK